MRSITPVVLSALLCPIGGCDAPFELPDPGPTGYLHPYGAEAGVDPTARPDTAALWRDGRVDVAAVFGQMDEVSLQPDDAGEWSADTLEWALLDRGFEASATADGHARLRGEVGARAVDVTLYRPAAFALGRSEAERRQLLREALAEHEVVYLNGHAFQGAWDVLDDPTAYRAHYRVVMLDVCWSWQLYTEPVLAAQRAGRRAHVVSARNRVVTGSVDALPMLLDALAANRSWRALLRDLDAAADERAAARHDLVEPRLRPAERYGVSLGVATGSTPTPP